MSGKRFTEEFKKEVTERGYSVTELAERLGTTTHSLYAHLITSSFNYNPMSLRRFCARV